MVPISESSSRQFLAAVRTNSSAGSTLMLSGKKKCSTQGEKPPTNETRFMVMKAACRNYNHFFQHDI